jgi:hypothetical protein
MIKGLEPEDYLDWNFDFFRVHRVIPDVPEDERGAFELKDLQITSLANNPSFGRSILASLLMRMYDTLWIEIDSPKDLLINPGARTMDDLAAHCHQTAQRKHPETLGNK